MNLNSKILLLGGSGLLGSAVHRTLIKQEYSNILKPRSQELNLLEKQEIEDYLKKETPEYIFMVAGLVGGIQGNSQRPADFLYQNTTMILNLLEGIKNNCPKAKILFTGSTCIYPKENPQPINEDRFMAGKLEETNKGYAVAKGTGIVACQLYRKQYQIDAICAMPTNLYGFNDNYDLENGHMIPGLIKKILLAKEKGNEVILWGTGTPRREALYSDDCADALVYLMKNYSSEQIINIGTGFDYSIKEISEIIKREVDWQGQINWDLTKPDGTFEKRTDIQRLKSIYPKFNPISLSEGVKKIITDPEQMNRILKQDHYEKKISVIMPVYNSEKYLSQAIESILNQTYTNFEFIIIDDKSSDNSKKIILSYKDNRIKYIRNKLNIGEQKSTNLGLSHAKGKYIAIMHSDDISQPDRLQTQLDYLNKNKNIFLIGTKYNIIDKYNNILNTPKIKQMNSTKIKNKLEKGKNIICHPSIMFKNDKITKYREKIFFCPDYDLYLQLLLKNKKINIINKVLFNYRIHPEQISTSKKYKQYLFKQKTLEFYFNKQNYNEFNPNTILNLNTKKLNLKDRIIYYHLQKKYNLVRKNYIQYFKKNKKIDKYMLYFLYSLLEKFKNK